MKSRETTFVLLLALSVGVLAFFAGYGFDRYLRHNLPRLKRRSVLVKDDWKRNFESCDQSWNDMDYDYTLFHDDAARKVDTKEIDKFHQYVSCCVSSQRFLLNQLIF